MHSSPAMQRSHGPLQRASSLSGSGRRVTCTDHRATEKHSQLFPLNSQTLFGIISEKTKLFLRVFSGICLYKSGDTTSTFEFWQQKKENRTATQERWYTHQTEYKASWLSTKLICICRTYIHQPLISSQTLQLPCDHLGFGVIFGLKETQIHQKLFSLNKKLKKTNWLAIKVSP